MKRYKQLPNLSFTYSSGGEHIGYYTEYGYTLASISHLKLKGVGLLITEEVLKNNQDYLCPINQNGKIGFINSFADIVITPQYDSVMDSFTSEQSIVRVCKESKWGLIDAEGNIVIDCQYRSLSHVWLEDYIVAQNEAYQYAIINIKTKLEIIPYGKYRLIYLYGRDHMMVQLMNNNLRGIIDIHENIIIPFKYKWISPFENDLARVITIVNESGKMVEKWGIIDIKGNYVVQPLYDNISTFKYGGKLAFATIGRKSIKLNLVEMCDKFPDTVPYHSIEKTSDNIHTYINDEDDEKTYYDGWNRDDVESGLADAYEGDLDARWNND